MEEGFYFFCAWFIFLLTALAGAAIRFDYPEPGLSRKGLWQLIADMKEKQRELEKELERLKNKK